MSEKKKLLILSVILMSIGAAALIFAVANVI